MPEFLRFVGPERAAELFGIRLIGINAETGAKLVVSLLFVAFVLAASRAVQWLALRAGGGDRERTGFWVRQGIRLVSAVVLVVGLTSVWFDQPARLATAAGLFSAGLAFALQRVITAVAGYFVILRGDVFNVGDRIVMGGVRGDVIGLTFIQTRIMEMGQPPAVQNADPAMWVRARQYTGRIVTVSNARIFDEAVYNYTRDLPYLWEEIAVPVPYDADHAHVERILLEAAHRHSTATAELGGAMLEEFRHRYAAAPASVEPRVYWRLTDNWLELSVRFVCPERGVREVKDAMTREILQAMRAAGVPVASASFVVAALPPLRLRRDRSAG